MQLMATSPPSGTSVAPVMNRASAAAAKQIAEFLNIVEVGFPVFVMLALFHFIDSLAPVMDAR